MKREGTPHGQPSFEPRRAFRPARIEKRDSYELGKGNRLSRRIEVSHFLSDDDLVQAQVDVVDVLVTLLPQAAQVIVGVHVLVATDGVADGELLLVLFRDQEGLAELGVVRNGIHLGNGNAVLLGSGDVGGIAGGNGRSGAKVRHLVVFLAGGKGAPGGTKVNVAVVDGERADGLQGNVGGGKGGKCGSGATGNGNLVGTHGVNTLVGVEGNVVDGDDSTRVHLHVEDQEGLGVLEGHLDIVRSDCVRGGGAVVGGSVQDVNLVLVGVNAVERQGLGGIGQVVVEERGPVSGSGGGSGHCIVVGHRHGIGQEVHAYTADGPVQGVGRGLPQRTGYGRAVGGLEELLGAGEEIGILHVAYAALLGGGHIDAVGLRHDGAVELTSLGGVGGNSLEGQFVGHPGGLNVHGLVASHYCKSSGHGQKNERFFHDEKSLKVKKIGIIRYNV